MTYLELYERAARLVDNGKITIGEYEEMIKPLEREICEWISADETPKVEGDYFVTFKSTSNYKPLFPPYFRKAKYVGYLSKWILQDGYSQDVTDEIIAWMPLPEPYREDGE